jgi:hypothetical protein
MIRRPRFDSSVLARAFARELHATIGASDYAEVLRRNATPEYDSACASHDFCDANMVMDAAFRDTFGVEFSMDDAAHVHAFNCGWDRFIAASLADPTFGISTTTTA